jgi:hypothetical protein
MTKEDKDLLLKDIYARIPYGVEGCCEGETFRTTPLHWYAEYEVGCSIDYMIIKSGWRPYLFPLSSMTEEQKKEYDSIIYHNIELHCERYYNVIDVDCYEELHDFYHKNHLDYRNLIGNGLAIDATNLNIY